MRRKKTDRQKLADRLWKVIQTYIRLRDNNQCQRCGKKVEKSNCHISHVVPKSHGNILKYDENNLKVLCYFCHLHWWHKNPIEAYEWFKDKFPERYKYIYERKENIVKIGIYELQEMIEEYTDRIIGLEIKNGTQE